MIISCPECNKDISDKAVSCPNCGYPLNNVVQAIDKSDGFVFPDLPADLSIGKQIVNWGGDACVDGYFDNAENSLDNIPTGKIRVILCSNGLNLCGSFYLPIMEIHSTQIISLNETTRQELYSKDKSVIGRSVVGGLILGPVGALVGGMSGIGSKTKMKNKHYLVINYWSLTTKKPATIIVGSEYRVTSFIKRCEKELEIK
ncbi:zinc-ribbon domain-containing protein [Clostridium sp. UBA1652]|uniref:zinc-ribbon domain-containing protein n=1 Tax=Clostridium sp. UBA1652 TaxID=1946348 RepID=UPI00257C6779|nr:zinc-ribbon domain-containing protein [Clostridium sp. UBA1652]